MYLGRIVAIGRTRENRAVALYRVSSRSFPNREAVLNGEQISILPRPGFESDLRRNPYISYNCVRLARNFAVATNGSQTDPIAEKIAMGYPARDAIALGLLALDYEKDALDTPRIVAVADLEQPVGYLGIIRRDALLVREFELEPGKLYYLSTYEKNKPCRCNCDADFSARTAEEAAAYAIGGGVFAGFENPVTSAAAVATPDGAEFAVRVV